jgi:hypothetical protein
MVDVTVNIIIIIIIMMLKKKGGFGVLPVP